MVVRFLIDSRERLSARNLYTFILEMKHYRVTHPIVFALLDHYVRASNVNKRSVAKLVHQKMNLLTSFVMRTALVARKFESSHFERGFSNLAQRVMSASSPEFVPLAGELRDSDEFGILDDSIFIQRIGETAIRDNAKAKRFLMGLAHYQQPETIILNERKYTVEHILPSSPTHLVGWSNFDEGAHRNNAYSIGNLTLLSEADNKPGTSANRSFSRKKAAYQESVISLTKELADNEDWSPDEIQARQERMAALAVQVWELPDA